MAVVDHGKGEGGWEQVGGGGGGGYIFIYVLGFEKLEQEGQKEMRSGLWNLNYAWWHLGLFDLLDTRESGGANLPCGPVEHARVHEHTHARAHTHTHTHTHTQDTVDQDKPNRG